MLSELWSIPALIVSNGTPGFPLFHMDNPKGRTNSVPILVLQLLMCLLCALTQASLFVEKQQSDRPTQRISQTKCGWCHLSLAITLAQAA